jgi:hypothetical protein
LPIDSDASFSFPIIDSGELTDDELHDSTKENNDPAPPNAQSTVPNSGAEDTEVNMIIQELTGQNTTVAEGLPIPPIRSTPMDEASGKELIYAMAFPTLYPAGTTDFNTPRARKVELRD